ncbi:hypothetical protein MKZ44_28150 (plasmid) [Klebsiella pneumoniae]|jgi:hypothetical protein|uniref:hypothetical protein n=1 Tax=Klebsiella pneumoniae TaxID=573 RepID=UPI001E3AA84D|nr:hypothetical protein [Klebsiella pneumoniae]MDV3394688.1 hypothetical protein [Klebsiella pneumoniae]UMR13271.1 hypothetical protein MKZ44_28150 [Klebsiella pneumoniae]WMJ67289.1 hypothetical protein RBI80_29795 [Klebsiella variicola]
MTVRLYYNAVDRRAQASNEWHAEWISKRGLKARLWTDKAISEFLGAPLSAGPVKAWKQKEVKKSKRHPLSKHGWNNVAHGWLRGVKYPLIQSCLATWMLR